jgi:TetR/AcrR family transcriptional regulator
MAGDRLQTTTQARQAKPAKPARRESAKGGPAVRERILEAALNLFATRGFDGTTNKDIAADCGIGMSVILYHFDSKEQLWRAAMGRLFAKVGIRPELEAATLKDLDIVSQLRVRLRSFAHLSAVHPQLGGVIMLEGIGGGPRLEWLAAVLLKPNYASWTDLVERGVEAGVLKQFDPLQIVMALHAASATYFNLAPLVSHLTGKSPLVRETIEQQADLVVDVLLDGLLVRDPPARSVAAQPHGAALVGAGAGARGQAAPRLEEAPCT